MLIPSPTPIYRLMHLDTLSVCLERGGMHAPNHTPNDGRVYRTIHDSESDLLAGASLRGLIWREPEAGQYWATAAGIVLVARDPSAVFPHCRLLADAYRGAEPGGGAVEPTTAKHREVCC